MLKFIWGKGHQQTAERLKIQNELFGLYKEVRHGFPHKPTALAYDSDLKLLAIGTKQGSLVVFGQPGVEFNGHHEDEVVVRKLLFLPGQGRIISLTEDNQLHLWEINGTKLEERKSVGMDGRLKQISVLCLDTAGKQVLLGTEGGNIYFLNLTSFEIDDKIVFQDIIMKDSPDDFKVNPGAVEALLLHPKESNKILIGYARGLSVLWDQATTSVAQTFVASQQLETLAWRNDGSQFISGHNDGSYNIWATSSAEPLEPPNTPYGPYPCKAINKIIWAHDSGETWLMFSGGMPRASYGDKYTVTIMKGEEQHTVLDLTSKIVDFLTISDANVPTSLVVLAEEELVVVDLISDGWPVFSLPYLNALHASAITCITQVSGIPYNIFDRIKMAGSGETLTNKKVSTRDWPISGGTLPDQRPSTDRDVLITGHEDGSVKFWNCSGVILAPMATVCTNKFFIGDELDEPREDDEEAEDEWPPFRKVGHFDPYSDDPRLAVKKVAFDGVTGRLFIGGTAGQLIILDLMDSDTDVTLTLVKTDLVTEKEGFAWKGHTALKMRTQEIKMAAGYQPSAIVQVSPPASINSIGFSNHWELVAVGTAHGLVIVDCVQKSVIHAKCTLNAQDIANADDNPMSRRKSFKKSLRESFRRLRKGRSQRNPDKKKNPTTTDPIKKELRSESPETRPVERAIEARTGSEDGLGSMVRCLHFAHTYIANPQTLSATLCAGTNSGQILVFLLNLPSGGAEKRATEKPTAMLAKEIQLRHKAPVISIQVINALGLPMSDASETSPDATTLPHRVLISSEEQFKLFVLPTLKPCGKYKLTAHEGARIRKLGFTTFVSKADSSYSENCLVCLTNLGELAIHSLPELRRQVVTSCMKKEDVQAISSFVWTPKGEAFYMASSSELQRISVAAAAHVSPVGTLSLAPNARPEMKDVKKSTAVSSATAAAKINEDDMLVARQNQLNEKEQAQANNGVNAASPDPHNETTISEISADITIDSVKDHTLNLGRSLPSLPEVVVHSEETTSSTATSTKITSSSVIKTSTSASTTQVVQQLEKVVLSSSETVQLNGDSKVNDLEESVESITVTPITSSSPVCAADKKNESEEPERVAPLASLESTSEFQSIQSGPSD